MQVEKISTSKCLLIRNLTVKQWMQKIRKDKELRKTFEAAKRELLGDGVHLNFSFV